MDPAEEGPFRAAIEVQGVVLGRHDAEISETRRSMESLTAQVADLTARLHRYQLEASAPRGSSSEPRINNPPSYAGEPTQCRAFLTQCEVVFSLQPATYAQDRARIAYIISLLTGRAREWGTTVWEMNSDLTNRFQLFKEEMVKVFDRSVHGQEASRQLAVLQQGRRSVADFAIEFRTLATSSGWNEPALIAHFLEGLNPNFKDEIYAREIPEQFDQLVELAIRLDKRFEMRRHARGLRTERPVTPPTPTAPVRSDHEAEPMQLGGIRISTAERQRRIINHLCLYCGSDGHFVSSCSVKARARQ